MISIRGACEHNLKNVDCDFERSSISIVTGVSGSGKSSLVFDTLLAEAQRKFFYTLSHYSRQFLDLNSKARVKEVSGLSPAISLSQNESKPSGKASVGSQTDLTELIGVGFSRFGVRYCPKHDLPTMKLEPEEVVASILDEFKGRKVIIYAPIVEDKKGAFQKQLTSFQAQGFLKAHIDGELIDLVNIPKLNKEKKHTIKVLIDQFKVQEAKPARLERSVKLALETSGGHCQVQEVGNSFLSSFSTKGGCPTCSYSWPEMDSRYFNPNSLGKCAKCVGRGAVDSDRFETMHYENCVSCDGTRISEKYVSILLGGHSVRELHHMSISRLLDHFQSVEKDPHYSRNQAFHRLISEIVSKVKILNELGLGYLNLGRRVLSLSGGEHQRLRLAGILGENLRGVIYILDEPSQGLHPSELKFVWEALECLRAGGNTVIIVDHDQYFMERADWVYDLGPTGGADGGRLVAKFRPSDAASFKKISKTAKHLVAKRKIESIDHSGTNKSYFVVEKPRLHNLKLDRVDFRLGALNVVSGLSGAGKTSLAVKLLFENVVRYLESGSTQFKNWWGVSSITGLDSIERALFVDRSSISRSTVSMPATYLDVLGDLRKLFAKLPDAQVLGYTVKTFSLNLEEGRCPECKGRGYISLTMKFLADVRQECSICHGRRFQDQVLDVQYQGHSIFDVLELTLEQFVDVFKNHKQLVKKILPAVELGLGYLKLGQPTSTLSGGEAQRLKLAPLPIKKSVENSLLIVNEVTRGLHFEDIEKLLAFLRRLTVRGATIVIAENSPELIRGADHLIELGPGAAERGGNLIYSGRPADCLKVTDSEISKFL